MQAVKDSNNGKRVTRRQKILYVEVVRGELEYEVQA